jgi:carboxymethylenebutenolidase
MMKTLVASDGHSLECWTTKATGERKLCLVILQEIFGVTDQLKKVADRYASQGYEVAIPALFDRHKIGTVVPFDQAAAGRDIMLGLQLLNTMRDIDAAVQHLSQEGCDVAVMGFCWGGGLAIRAAQTLDISGAVAFYPTRLSEYFDRPLKAPVLAHFGLHDSHVPMDVLNKAKTFMPEMTTHTYEAGHAFANDERAEFVTNAASLAHKRSEVFLQGLSKLSK